MISCMVAAKQSAFGSPLHALVDGAGQVVAMAVIHCEGDILAVQVEAVAIRLGVVEHGAEFFLSLSSIR
jgi:hypothetical protein